MQIRLNVSRHCVHTAAKRAYTRAVNQALKGPQSNDPELEARIEVLKTALEEMDLAVLRGKHPELAGGSDVDVRLHKDEQGRLSLLLQGQEVQAVTI
ncbi:hypothetical protein [Desulfovermiculus halophilus]|jgi:glutamate formiminotransferase|uniref:hypothetical protein n=1 Tax=Desulfovermiculus halophilus TaxID=339722 RepID=UPI0004834B85|nr:hypothetical protein [Desulfovermiculus halophilus]